MKRRSIERINQEIIDQIVALGGFGEVVKTEGGIQRYRQSRQVFAVDGRYAYDVTAMAWHEDDSSSVRHLDSTIIRPVIVGGSVFLSQPDEGSGGVLCDMVVISPKRGLVWRHLSWLSCGWLYTRELDLAPAEIARNIMDDIDAGHTYITGAVERG